jgi:signal transduction histidine kinase
MLAHDIRNPLFGVQKTLEVALAEVGATSEARGLIADAQMSCDILIDMLGDMLDAHRLEGEVAPLRAREIDLVSVVTKSMRMVQSLAREKGVSILLDHGGEFPRIFIDQERLTRVLVNLLHNAIKYSPEESTVDVSIETPSDEYLKISITDHGEGIPMEEAEKIFGKYYQHQPSRQTDNAGFGWGLYFCALAVSAMGGEIWVEPPPIDAQHGARFCFTLPIL